MSAASLPGLRVGNIGGLAEICATVLTFIAPHHSKEGEMFRLQKGKAGFGIQQSSTCTSCTSGPPMFYTSINHMNQGRKVAAQELLASVAFQ